MLRTLSLPLALWVAVAACGRPARPADEVPAAAATPAPAPALAEPVTISIVGTSDLHGRVLALPLLAGYVRNLRAARERDGGGVVLVDAGDMFQGTLESNLGEGAVVIDAYNAMGYAAAAVGNHEFDFGPAGDAATPQGPGDDPRGALKARAAQARFPLLVANVTDAETGARVAWENAPASTTVELGGVTVGIIGVTTEDTPTTTMAANFAGLAVAPLADAIAAEARRLRAAGADAVVVTAHAGGGCERFDDPDDLSSCKPDTEIFRVARALPAGLVDAIIGGHSHQAVAHRVGGVPIAQAWSYGRAFARIDLTVRGDRVTAARLHPPIELCPDAGACTYEGAPVEPVAEVVDAVAPAVERASEVRAQPLDVTVTSAVMRAYARESALGNLFADLMLAARPDADVALVNGGGLRADLPAGNLTYGALYEAMPFDNRFATVKLRASDLAALVENNLKAKNGIVSLAGVRATARCEGDQLRVTLRDDRNRRLAADAPLTVVTSDFLASGGDGAFAQLSLPSDAIRLDDGPTIRDAMASVLRGRAGELAGDRLLDPTRPRLRYPGARPVSCPAD